MPGTGPSVKIFDVIRTEAVTPNVKDGKPIHVLIDSYSMVRDDITSIIGNPLNYPDWEKTRSNPKGDNTIPPRKVNPKNQQMNKKPS